MNEIAKLNLSGLPESLRWKIDRSYTRKWWGGKEYSPDSVVLKVVTTVSYCGWKFDKVLARSRSYVSKSQDPYYNLRNTADSLTDELRVTLAVVALTETFK